LFLTARFRGGKRNRRYHYNPPGGFEQVCWMALTRSAARWRNLDGTNCPGPIVPPCRAVSGAPDTRSDGADGRRCRSPGGLTRAEPSFGRETDALVGDLRRRCVRPQNFAGSIEHWLVHPWGARPRGNGSQPEATGPRFHAQNGGSRQGRRGGPYGSSPPSRTSATGPGSQIRGFVHFGPPSCAGGLECLGMFVCRRCCGAALLIRL
jgi:hypothetical protein